MKELNREELLAVKGGISNGYGVELDGIMAISSVAADSNGYCYGQPDDAGVYRPPVNPA